VTEEEKKERQREACRRYRAANRDRLLAQEREKRKANPEAARERDKRKNQSQKGKERQRRWAEANRERKQESHQKWRENNKGREQQRCRDYYWADPIRARQRVLEYNRQNPERAKAAQHARRALMMSAADPAAPVSASSITRRVWLFGNCCAYCGSDGPLHLDHVEPLARGGLHTPDNLVPACQRCNLSKQAKPVEAWYLSQPFFSAERWEALQAHTGKRWSAAEQLSLMDLLAG
jgi:5-methylcytosine-specific restriction endonuclease McrA